MLAQVLACIGASAAIFLTYTLLAVVQTEPWYSPQYFIPILGEGDLRQRLHLLLLMMRSLFLVANNEASSRCVFPLYHCAGMMLGNAISGVSVGLTALLEEFAVGKLHNHTAIHSRMSFFRF